MSFSTHFIKRPVATSLLMAAILAVGSAAYPFLPIASVPQIDFPTIQVNANLPGASPETMASSVAQPLERQFSQIPGIDQMTSTSALGKTQVTLQFDLDRNIDGAAQDVQSAINAANGLLPRNMPAPPSYQKVNPADPPIAGFGYASDVLPLTEVDDQVENLVLQQISQLPGVGSVNVLGQQKPAIRIQIDPIKLASTGLSLEDVRTTITNASTNAPKGNIEVGPKGFTIYGNDQIVTAAAFNDVVLTFRNGAPVRVRDIGQAVDGPEDTKKGAWDNNGRRIVASFVNKQPGANVVETAKNVYATVERASKLLPPSIHPYIFADRIQTIRASVSEVKITLLLTAALVVVVIFVFLRNFAATVIPALAIPLALIGTFAGMYLFNYSIDNLSLMAMTIAVGFVVDDAIVMLENIYRHIEHGEEPLTAAIKGASEIGFTIISMSLSLVAVFIPLLLMSGIVGRLFHEFAMTVSMTILISGFVSLTLTPMLCSKFLRHEGGQHGALYLAIERGFQSLFGFYRRTLDSAFQNQRKVFAVFIATVAASGFLYVVVPKGFFPQQDVGSISVNTEGPQDVSFAEMARLQDQAREILMKDRDILAVASTMPYGGGSINNGKIYVLLKPYSERDNSDVIMNRLRPQLSKIAGLRVFLQVSQDINVGARGARTQYQYTLQDANIDELNDWSARMVAGMSGLREIRDVSSDQQLGATTATLTIDRDQAARYGIQPQLIDDTLYDAFGQRQVGQYFTQVNTYRIIEEILPDLQSDLRTLDRIFVKSPTSGQNVPLSTFVKLDTRKVGAASISHQGQFPATTISFNLSPGVALGDAVEAINKMKATIGAPSGLNGSFQGTARAFQESLASQPILVAAAILAVYVILGMLYESYIYPLAILSTLPSAGVGALLMLLIAKYDLSVIALVGVLLLIGLVKKNGIMMVDFAINAQRAGATPLAAIREACHLRFRPIMMTSMAALLGGLPLMFSTGAGSELRRPLGLAMVGGLLVSQVLTLYTTPVVYLYLERLRAWNQARRAAAADALPQQSPAE